MVLDGTRFTLFSPVGEVGFRDYFVGALALAASDANILEGTQDGLGELVCFNAEEVFQVWVLILNFFSSPASLVTPGMAFKSSRILWYFCLQ